MEVVLAPGDSGILLHEAVGHGLEADFNRKGTSNYSGQMNQTVASDLCTVIDDATLLAVARHDQRRRRRLRAAESSTLIEKGKLSAYMHDRMSANHYGIETDPGNGRRESFASATDAAHDQHDLDRRTA